MFQSFTGNARRPRQVNLGGRTTNPFAAFPSGRTHPHGSGPQNTLAIAQQERLLRQRERERLGASRTLQRVWRGYRSRKDTRSDWRSKWDAAEQRRTESLLSFESPADHSELALGRSPRYSGVEECLPQLKLLVYFLEVTNANDVIRLVYFSNALQETLHEAPAVAAENEWTLLLGRLASETLGVLRFVSSSAVPAYAVNPLLKLLVFLTGLIPKQIARKARSYFSVMATLTKNINYFSQESFLSQDNLVQVILALLRPITSETLTAYEWFAKVYLTTSNLPAYLGTLDGLANNINYKLLTSTLESQDFRIKENTTLDSEDVDARLWLLAYYIYFHRCTFGSHSNHQVPEPEFVKIVSELLNSTAVHIARRLELEDATDVDASQGMPLPLFVKEQVLSLVNQRSITGLLTKRDTTALFQGEPGGYQSDALQEAKILATYALTLLRVFPRRGDDIRMWLYLGSANRATEQPEVRIPAIKYFWQATRSSRIFQTISQDSNNVLPLLKPADDAKVTGASGSLQFDREQEWTIVLLFLELYTFVLKVMDDDEFFSSSSSFAASANTRVSWTRESALPLNEVKDMTLFLKNLAFTLYWNAADLNDTETVQDTSGFRNYFSSLAPLPDPVASIREYEAQNKDKGLPGVTGIPLDYFKGLVTGLLRMIHERDSRRKFLPDGHLLMTNRFDMEGFIPAVVAEEENRHQLQDEEDEEGKDDVVDEDYYDPTSQGLVGTGHAQQIRRIEALRRRQQQAARRRRLQAVAPRLEILRNMPFFIPFTTRVQIFREFIFRDQMRRRHGFIDPDIWRMRIAQASMGRMLDGRPVDQDILSKHHANIRRQSVFDDAFDQFYGLGDGLKEPIQISFIDQFDTVEAGIDGGGVTKEFLTSVTNEAFKSPTNELNLFEENDQHLLYPNPAAVEERRELLRQLGYAEGSPDWNEQVRDLLRRYEFLGRVIGKCLYEGILVDVNFAPFFLLKWALTGGTGSAQRESAYRANLNDLKDLDVGLYQGLVSYNPYPLLDAYG